MQPSPMQSDRAALDHTGLERPTADYVYTPRLHLTACPVEDALHDMGGTTGFTVPHPVMPVPARAGLPDDVCNLLAGRHDALIADAVNMDQHRNRPFNTLNKHGAALYINERLAEAARIRTALANAGETCMAETLLLSTSAITAAVARASWPHPMGDAA